MNGGGQTFSIICVADITVLSSNKCTCGVINQTRE